MSNTLKHGNHDVYKLVVVEEVSVEVENESEKPERKKRRVTVGEREVLKGVLVAWSPIFATMLSERWELTIATNDKRVDVKRSQRFQLCSPQSAGQTG